LHSCCAEKFAELPFSHWPFSSSLTFHQNNI
jgi:hypothetical protein